MAKIEDKQDRTDDKRIESPCIRNCCLDENNVCVGCFRSLDEIVAWGSSTNKEKKKILEECVLRRTQ